MRSRFQTLALAMFVAVTLDGCASAGTTPGRSNSRTILTAEQLAASNSDNLFDAISKLRPEWLSSRGVSSVTDPSPTVASVYLNGSMIGKADAMKEMRVLDVTEVRYWDAASAAARFGMGHPRGVIELTRK